MASHDSHRLPPRELTPQPLPEGSGDDEELDMQLRMDSVEHLAKIVLSEVGSGWGSGWGEGGMSEVGSGWG